MARGRARVMVWSVLGGGLGVGVRSGRGRVKVRGKGSGRVSGG